jgi:hypothetical protein
MTAVQLFHEHYGGSVHRTLIEKSVEARIKTGVPGATGVSGNWGNPLMPESLGSALLAYANRYSVLARAGLASVPFNVRLPAESAALGGFGWIGQRGLAVKVTKGAITSTSALPPLTAAGLIVLTRELIRFGSPAAVAFLRERLARGIAAFIDRQFVDQTLAAVADTNPASITYGVTPVESSGTTAAAAAVDFGNLLETYLDAGGSVETAAFLLGSRTAVALRLSGHFGLRAADPRRRIGRGDSGVRLRFHWDADCDSRYRPRAPGGRRQRRC